ncbi:major facilitator superfamily domain-containing protein [Colletotrichum phormii]|uniref:Major facilitator superfamily domain-containing protein n=1 Tax=Colletotrichum phormii TaxID=359342 RepID=A0AAI9ZPS8_9PEZI|nr:major facilitator superfamily domain-containing protein [Colletotrichum phormii]KAK1635571.1 major facilitator superfamily domain-containing protein [Colletotrichum phormii]
MTSSDSEGSVRSCINVAVLPEDLAAAFYPEGGTQAWLAVAGSFLVYFASFGVVNSFGFFQTFYQQEYLKNYSPTAISFIGTLQITLMYLSGAVAGALFDLYGPKWLYLFAAIGGAGSMLATSFTQPNAIWQQFLVQSLLFGLTVAYGVQPALTVAGQYFHRKRALAMGIVASGSSFGGVCLPIMFSKLIPTIGFPWALRVGALIMVICYAIAIAVSSSKRPKRKMRSFRDLLDYKGFLDIRYSCLSPEHLFGRIIGGHSADRIGRLNFLYPMILLCGLLCVAMWLPATTPGVLAGFACLYGFASGVFISVMPAATGQIIPADRLGARLGAFGTVTSMAFLTGSPIAGALITSETRAGYHSLIIFAGCCLLGGGAIIFVARLLHDRNLKSKW